MHFFHRNNICARIVATWPSLNSAVIVAVAMTWCSTQAVEVKIIAEQGQSRFGFDVFWDATMTSSSAVTFGVGSAAWATDAETMVEVSSYYGDPFPTPTHTIVLDFGLSGDPGRAFELGDLVGASGGRVVPLPGTPYGARFLYSGGSPNSMPETGTSAVFLGTGIFGLAWFRRWVAQA